MCEEIYTSEPPAKSANGPELRIYSNPICPFAQVRTHSFMQAPPTHTPGDLLLHLYSQRTRIVVAHLNVPHEIVNIHLQRKPEWFKAKINPHGQVPVVEHNGHLIRESAISSGNPL